MSTAALLQKAAPTAQPSGGFNVGGLLLQRKCACGSPAASLTGECPECMSKKRLQPKLAIGASHDPLELEADRVADQVMSTSRNRMLGSAPLRVQRFTGSPTATANKAPASVDKVVASPGQPLEPALRRDMERRFGHDFSQVRVHVGAAAGRSAREVNAHAYTVGHDVVFNAGKFSPGTQEGRRLLAHELTHVVQQSRAPEIKESGRSHGTGAAATGKPSTPSISTSTTPMLARFEPSPQFMPPPMTRPAPGVMPAPGTLVPETGPRYAPEPTTDFYEMYERAKKEPDCESAQLELEIPVATLSRGGKAPDFVTSGPKQKAAIQLTDTCHITFTPQAFHILDAIEYGVGRATTNAHLKDLLDKYIDARKPIGLVQPFVISPRLDTGGVTRVQVYSAAVKKRMAQGPKFDPAMDPTLVLPEELPAEAVQKGCRVTPGRGLFDPRFDPQFDNWMAATYCQQVTGSLFEYRVTTANGEFAIYDGKKGSVVYECKCGYESLRNLESDDPRKRSRAEQGLMTILRQKENHALVARACGLSLTYKVSSEFLARTLQTAWSDVSVEHRNIVGFPTENCAP
jgi:hypothetical protein